MGDTKICRYCGQIIDMYSENCEYCGKYLNKEHDNKDLFCKKCKHPVNTDDNFCQFCGAIFNLPSENETQDIPLKHNMIGIHYNIVIFLTSLVLSLALAFFITTGKDSSTGAYFAAFGITFVASEILLYIYLLPSIIAIENNNKNTYFIFICNLLLGITVVGWFVALVSALQSKR